eukprot:3607126-Pyramimonas_sp.AAC.1
MQGGTGKCDARLSDSGAPCARHVESDRRGQKSADETVTVRVRRVRARFNQAVIVSHDALASHSTARP